MSFLTSIITAWSESNYGKKFNLGRQGVKPCSSMNDPSRCFKLSSFFFVRDLELSDIVIAAVEHCFSMKVAKQKAPLRKEPFPLLNEWKVSTNSVDLHPKLAQLSKLVNEDGLTWDQQVTILRKLGMWGTTEALNNENAQY